MFSLCLREFSLSTQACLLGPKDAHVKLIGYSQLCKCLCKMVVVLC